MKRLFIFLLKFIDKYIKSYLIRVFIFRIFQKLKYFKIILYVRLQYFIFNLYILKKKKINIIFDYKCAPPTYGDFISFLMLIRFFISNNLNVNFYIIDGEYRDDWSNLTSSDKKNLLCAHKDIIGYLIDKKYCIIKTITWDQFFSSRNFNYLNTFLYKNIQQRTNCYSQAINFLNLFDYKKNINKKFFLRKNIFKNYVFKKALPEKFITLNARFQKNWEPFRNLSVSEFDNNVNYLLKKYPKHKIIVVTDKLGKSYFQNKTSIMSNNLLFSKDFSSCFCGDALLVLLSSFYMQLKGGGIGIIPMFSRTPYSIKCSLNTEIMVSNNKLFSWQTDRQQFILLRKY